MAMRRAKSGFSTAEARFAPGVSPRHRPVRRPRWGRPGGEFGLVVADAGRDDHPHALAGVLHEDAALVLGVAVDRRRRDLLDRRVDGADKRDEVDRPAEVPEEVATDRPLCQSRLGDQRVDEL
jgi:hypothetical protein